ncbi:MAG TPA: hypothetical protein VFP87_02920 [Chitinophagaceae bacterium]|nr:hypothetical protein [Chitinophagaceae bacterium]
MDAVATLVKSIFQKESLQDCSVEELNTLAQQFPYFTPAQFLLAKKLTSAHDNRYQEQLQKLSLHFNNPLWLDYLLNGYSEETETETMAESGAPSTALEDEKIVETPVEATFIKSEAEIAEPIREEVNKSIDMPTHISMENDVVGTSRSEEPVAEETVEASNVDIPEPISDELTAAPGEIVQQQQQEPETFGETVSGLASASAPLHEEQLIDPDNAAPKLPDLSKVPEGELTFEPYHTVDYFASQGIKFVAEEKPSDRFGQQLKSFTEWLKTMKRLPHAEMVKTSDASAEQEVQQLADHSVSEGEVVTETMAEVWAKQGNKEKAIETYNKLSLLNPDKSAYFASLVDQLKNS